MKNMNRIIGFFSFLLCCTILMVACSTKSEENLIEPVVHEIQKSLLPDEIAMLDLIDEPTSGYVGLTSFSTLSTQNYREQSVKLRADMFDSAGLRADYGTLSLDNVTLNTTGSLNNYETLVGNTDTYNMYGNSVDLTLAGNGSLPSITSTPIYVPELLTITSPQFANNLTISSNFQFSWVVDNTNPFDKVGIRIEYDPTSTENTSLGGNHVYNDIVTDDTGNYTVTSNDLSGIPVGGIIKVYLARGTI